MEITKEIWFDMWHRVPNHKSKCSNVHWHRYTVYITLEWKLIEEIWSDEWMVIDFWDIKTISKWFIDKQLDHWFMYYEKDQIWQIISEQKNSRWEKMKTIKVSFIPTAENIAKRLFKKLEPLFTDRYNTNLKLKQIKLYETPTSYVIYKK